MSDFTDAEIDKLLEVMCHKERLTKLTAEQLIAVTLGTTHADSIIVVELMNRVLPHWEQRPDNYYDDVAARIIKPSANKETSP